MWWRTELNLEKGASYLSGSPLTFLRGEKAAIFIGHSTVLIHLDEQNFLTDPFYLKRLYILQRHLPPGVPFQNLPPLNFILISHGHLDHMDLNTLSLFPRSIPVVLPEKLEKYLIAMGFEDVRSLSWGERTVIGNLMVQALSVKHFSGRSLCETRSMPQSYLVQGAKTIFFGGDSGLTEEFRKIGAHSSIDLAFLPIGNYRPASFRRVHMNPEDALIAMEMLGAKRMAPIHWGAFRLSMEPPEEPPRQFRQIVHEKGISPKVILWQPGEKIIF
jgi:L-ascorbate metabolism protein UlaG (beta-lactamase superfamily)